MKTRSASVAVLESGLEDALARARTWDFDLPSDLAIRQAHRLFQCLSSTRLATRELAISISEDGAIAIYRTNGARSVTVEIEPVSGSLGLVVADERSKSVITSSMPSTEADVVRELERAA